MPTNRFWEAKIPNTVTRVRKPYKALNWDSLGYGEIYRLVLSLDCHILYDSIEEDDFGVLFTSEIESRKIWDYLHPEYKNYIESFPEYRYIKDVQFYVESNKNSSAVENAIIKCLRQRIKETIQLRHFSS